MAPQRTHVAASTRRKFAHRGDESVSAAQAIRSTSVAHGDESVSAPQRTHSLPWPQRNSAHATRGDELVTACLDEEQIVRLSRGALTDSELTAADDHLDECEICRRVLAAVVNEATSDVRIVGDRYELDALIGAGAHGLVWSARDVKLERRVALKRMRRTSAAPLSEARLMARVSHPSVVQVFDVGEDFVAMEFVAGPTLRSWLTKSPSFPERLRVMREAGEALGAVHLAGLVHRDFKPDNVLIDPTGRARVTDFGLAQTEADGSIGGTPAYMAPEQQGGARADQFSFCVTLFEVITGRRPTTPIRIPPDVPPNVARVLERGLSIDPAARFESMEALLAALAVPPARLAWWPWLLAAVVLLGVVGVISTIGDDDVPAPVVAAVKAPVPQRVPQAPGLQYDYLEEETPLETLPPAGEAIVLAPGAVRTFTLARLTRVFIADPEIVDAAGNEDELQFVAKGVGKTRVTLETKAGKRTWPVIVRQFDELSPVRVELKVGAMHVVKVTGLNRVSIGDSTIVDVQSRTPGDITFQALVAGRTNGLLWTNDARRLEIVFEVIDDVISLELGVQRVLKVGAFSNVEVIPAASCSIEVVGDGEVLLVPRAVGAGRFEFKNDDGTVSVRRFRVR